MSYSPTWTPNALGASLLRLGLTTIGSARKNIHVHDRALTAAEVAALAAAGHDHDIRTASGAWTSLDPGVVAWEGLANGSNQVLNTGTGGACALQLTVGKTVAVGAVTRVPRVATIGAYPPVRTFYRTTGSAGSFLRSLGSRLPRIVFPDGGGLGSFALRWWIRRPVTPAVTDGTLMQITAGDARITVAIAPTDMLVVNIDDGTAYELGAESDAIPTGMTWVAVVVSYDEDTEELTVYVNGTSAFVFDTGSLTIPDAESNLTFTIGETSDGSDSLDFDIAGIAGYDEPWTPAEALADFEAGWTADPRNAEPEPDVLWVEPIEDGVVPGAIESDDPLIPFSVTSITEPSDFWAWAISTHQLGVYSTAWWPGSALVASNWHLTYDTGEVTTGERVFGECPRVARVTMRADGVLLIDVDAALQPRVTYVLAADVDDFAGENPGDMSVDGPAPAREHTADLVPALLDIDAPLRAGLRVTDSGDFGMASETRTVEKMLWALVLTPRGSVDWDPQFGSALRAKRLRPMDLKQEHRRLVALAMGVPYVKAAAVQLLFEGDEIVVEFNITSDFGSFYTRRAVDAS